MRHKLRAREILHDLGASDTAALQLLCGYDLDDFIAPADRPVHGDGARRQSPGRSW